MAITRAVFASFALVSAVGASTPTPDELWQNFTNTYSKIYAPGDESYRKSVFLGNLEKISDHNANNDIGVELGVTEFADMTSEEFQKFYLGGYKPELRSSDLESVPWTWPAVAAPDSVDWVAKGAVTKVKNQQRCGSCWAFSTTGSTEGAYYIASGKLLSLSEEDLVQCDHNGDQGCSGGLMDNAFEWIKKNGIASEAAYPYTSGSGRTGTCNKAKSSMAVVTMTGHTDVPAGDEEALKAAVAIGPVSVAIEADKTAFQLYHGGILDNPLCGKKLDHGVLVVGYGTDGGKDYWKVKNSWGPTWGENGYVRMVRGKNQCGIAQQPSYPTGVKAASPSPSPGPSPGPSPPSPPTPSESHYEDPKDGCQTDEVDISIQGVAGSVCAPSCSLFKRCPTDLPTGVTARPQCALQDSSSGKKYCALICNPSSNSTNDDQCGANASCKSIQMVGICTYDDDSHGVVSLPAATKAIVV